MMQETIRGGAPAAEGRKGRAVARSIGQLMAGEKEKKREEAVGYLGECDNIINEHSQAVREEGRVLDV